MSSGIPDRAEDPSDEERNWVVAQLGARMHYAVPTILHRAGLLRRLCTDIHIPARWTSRIVPKLRRYHIGQLPRTRIRAFTIVSFMSRSLSCSANAMDRYRLGESGSIHLGRLVAREQQDRPIRSLYGFDTASRNCFAVASDAHLVLEQCVAPRSTQRELFQLGVDREWHRADAAQAEAFDRLHETELEEWETAHCIVTPSDFVRNEVVKAAPEVAHKVIVVPYGFSPQNLDTSQEVPKSERPTVLFAGTVGYRKGILDLLEVARRTPHIAYRVAGQVSPDLDPVTHSVSNVRILGKLSQSEVFREMQSAWCFFLPSWLEGSATVVYESMAFGLPVVTTPNAGSVVRHGEEGAICAAGDVTSMAEQVSEICGDARLRQKYADCAKLRAEEFTVEKYGQRLRHSIQDSA